MKTLLLLTMLCFSVQTALFGAVSATGKTELHDLLQELDALIARRESFISRHEVLIDSLKAEAHCDEIPLRRQYELTAELADAYFAYQSDSMLYYLTRNLALAERMGDNDLVVRAKSDIALCYSLNGRFLEAEQTLSELTDTLHLSDKARDLYYAAQHRKNREFCNQLGPGPARERVRRRELYYAAQAMLTHTNPVERLYYAYMKSITAEEWEQADALCDSLLRICPPDSHSYAKAANHKAYLAKRAGHAEQMVCWFVRSAMADMQAAVRDYGSLGAVSVELLRRGDAQRAMRYIRIAINDTRFYNSPMRSWRDMNVLPQIEQAYNERNGRVHTMYIVLIVIVTLFAVSAVGGVLFMLYQNRRLNAVQQTLRESNDRLNELARNLRETNGCLNRQNARIADANRIKEVYIGGFLKTISEYINKLADSYRYVNKMLRNDRIEELAREYARSTVKDDELKEFYALFDTMFLELYPSFIDEFNSLLSDEGRIVVRRAGVLTTELRIFALVRLGITDTATIASLLHCSINTIYSYRSRVRLLARDGGRDFEQQVSMLGLGGDSPQTNNPNDTL